MGKIRVGIVGTGFIGPTHIEALRRLPNIEVTALSASGREKAETKALELGIPMPMVITGLCWPAGILMSFISVLPIICIIRW